MCVNDSTRPPSAAAIKVLFITKLPSAGSPEVQSLSWVTYRSQAITYRRTVCVKGFSAHAALAMPKDCMEAMQL